MGGTWRGCKCQVCGGRPTDDPLTGMLNSTDWEEIVPDRPKYEGDPPLDEVTQRFVDTVVADDPSYGGVEAIDLLHVLRRAGLSITMTDDSAKDPLPGHIKDAR